MQIMFSGLTPTSRQRKFCEGFLFFPIRHLRKYGNHIFRQYGRHAGVKTLLDMQLGMPGNNDRYAEEIQRCIADKAAPETAKVMLKLEEFYTQVQASAGSLPGLYLDFSDLIIHFYREVSIYHNVILRNMKQELQPAGRSKKREPEGEPAQEHINKLYKVVKEFVLQSKTMLSVLEDVARKENYLPGEQYLRHIMELMSGIRQMNHHQQHLCQLLKKWGADKNLHMQQTYYN